jgi:hypothetical protein
MRLSVFGWMWSSKIEILLSLVGSRYTIWHVFTKHKLVFHGYVQHQSLADLKTITSSRSMNVGKPDHRNNGNDHTNMTAPLPVCSAKSVVCTAFFF